MLFFAKVGGCDLEYNGSAAKEYVLYNNLCKSVRLAATVPL